MKYRTAFLLGAALGVCLAPVAGLAADGDACATTGRTARRGWEVSCNLVCDTKTSASTTCSNFTLTEAADTYVIEFAEDEGCSGAAELDVSTQGVSTDDTHELAELIRGGDTRVVIDGSAAHPDTILTFALSTMTDCTDLDVKLWRYHRR